MTQETLLARRSNKPQPGVVELALRPARFGNYTQGGGTAFEVFIDCGPELNPLVIILL